MLISLDTLSLLSILLPSGMVFLFWSRLAAPFKFIGMLVLFTLLMEGAGYLLFLKGSNNMPLFHLFTYIEAILIVFYYRSIFANRKLKNLYGWFLVGFLVFSVINFMWREDLYHYNSIQRAVECIWAMVLFMIFYADLFSQSTVTNLTRYPHYWMTSGFLLYFAGTLFMNVVLDSYVQNDIVSYKLLNIHSILNIFLNIIYTIVVWMGSKASISDQ